MEKLANLLPDGDNRGVFTSQFLESRSNITMGRRTIEQYVEKPVEAELCRWAHNMVMRDYKRWLEELASEVLGHEVVEKFERVEVID
jgi:hypothetical protein